MRYLNEGFKYVTGTPSALHLNMYTKSQLKKGITSPQKPSKAQVVLPSLTINILACDAVLYVRKIEHHAIS